MEKMINQNLSPLGDRASDSEDFSTIAGVSRRVEGTRETFSCDMAARTKKHFGRRRRGWKGYEGNKEGIPSP